jgi:hypothetical protein
MNILQCCFSLYRVIHPQPPPKYEVNCGYISHISRSDTIVMRHGNSMIKKYITIDGVHTPKVNLNDREERAAAIYAIKRLKYMFINRYAVIDDKTGDVFCGNVNVKTWMLANRIAVANNEVVPRNWTEYIQSGKR